VSYALSCLDLLAYVDDSTNVRAFFENTLAALPAPESRPVWDRFIAYELERAQGGAALATVQSLEQRRAAAHPHLASAEARLLARQLHRYAVFGAIGGTAVDAGFLSRQPYSPLATLHRPPAATPDAGLYLQAPVLRSTPLSHLPAGRVLTDLAGGEAAALRLTLSGTPAAPPSVMRLLQMLPAYDPRVPERIVRAGGSGGAVSWRDAAGVMAAVTALPIPGVNVGAKRKLGLAERDG
jgi:hypothetical protein